MPLILDNIGAGRGLRRIGRRLVNGDITCCCSDNVDGVSVPCCANLVPRVLQLQIAGPGCENGNTTLTYDDAIGAWVGLYVCQGAAIAHDWELFCVDPQWFLRLDGLPPDVLMAGVCFPFSLDGDGQANYCGGNCDFEASITE